MSRNVLSFSLAAIIGSLSLNSFAEETKGFYIGAGYGLVKLQSSDDFKISNPKNGSLQFGYSFSENWAIEGEFSSSITDGSGKFNDNEDITYELRNELIVNQGLTSSAASQIVKSANTTATVKTDISVETSALYGVYRTSGPLYAKIKAGAVSVKADISVAATNASVSVVDSLNRTTVLAASQIGLDLQDFSGESSDRKTEFSAGIGAGYKFGNKVAAELEYTRLNDDLDLYTVSVKYFF